MVLDYAVREAQENCLIRLTIGPCPRHIELPAGYRLTFGQGVSLTAGDDAVLFAYGPVMLQRGLERCRSSASSGIRPAGGQHALVEQD